MPHFIADFDAGQKSSWGHHHVSDVFQPEFVVHRLTEFLLAKKITFGGLNRCLSKQELNLCKFSPSPCLGLGRWQ